MTTEHVTYYALREAGEQQATGLFRDRRIPGVATYLERIDGRGSWVRDNLLIGYLMGEPGAERVSEHDAAMIVRRLRAERGDTPDTPPDG